MKITLEQLFDLKKFNFIKPQLNPNYKGFEWDVITIKNDFHVRIIEYNKTFSSTDDMKSYIDKVILRKKKLERLKN